MTSYREEIRADRAAQAEQRRLDAAAVEERRAERQKVSDERAARLRDQARADREADRAGRQRRRRERAERRASALTPSEIYRRGTLVLVTVSALASLPAQVMHFVGIDPVLLPLPLALEGAAWVTAAGVAYADARRLPGWVRWFLRALVASFAGFAAYINYGYGLSLTASGLTSADADAVGAGLAAVTLLGPVLFEIRQWVAAFGAASDDGKDAARRRHNARRRRHHRKVRRLANRLVSAAPFESLSEATAWERAWEIVHGCAEPGMTPELHRKKVGAAQQMAAARQSQRPTGPAADMEPNADETAVDTANQSGSDLRERVSLGRRWAVRIRTRPARRSRQRVGSAPKPTDAPPVVPAGRPVVVAAASSTRPRRATGQVPQSARTTRPKRTPDELLEQARSATADWPTGDLTADRIRKAVRTSADNARTLREALKAERAARFDERAA
ncbi:hypothetical protein [Streptomyces angustmyceticus]|uniref:hypothetical protein n=1 Tax=Streptomyces angustmyceticus TaxID=285578 RepID=UPI0021AF9047|nr:hypothetical protein [Streptomyces angustmyceticus]